MASCAALAKLDPDLRLFVKETGTDAIVHVIAGLMPGQRVPPDFEGVPVEWCGPVTKALCLQAKAIVRLAEEPWVAYVKALDQPGPQPGRPA